MSVQNLFVISRCRKSLCVILAILAVSFVAQRQYAQSSAKAQAKAYAQSIDETIQASEALRTQRIEDGVLWLGALHEDLAIDGDALDTPQPNTALEGQRRVSIIAMPLESDTRYRMSMEIHECDPGSDACSSGGSIRLTTAAGEPVFRCEFGVLLLKPKNQSYYSLLWNADGPSLSAEERLQLLETVAAASGQPNAPTFFKNLQSAYAYTNHLDGRGKREAMRLWKTILTAIIADRS